MSSKFSIFFFIKVSRFSYSIFPWFLQNFQKNYGKFSRSRFSSVQNFHYSFLKFEFLWNFFCTFVNIIWKLSKISSQFFEFFQNISNITSNFQISWIFFQKLFKIFPIVSSKFLKIFLKFFYNFIKLFRSFLKFCRKFLRSFC